eukprot:TRINITY_DN13627_c0_g1_i1.p1 TRINITY_DN13627_c0_g1~~TRINITY_DN13627_c0_g1_i1.p1  ORF type:complete len:177 (-),score=27.37 TRINITY_DN13627_c0_g1_i1:256-786(-)
MLVGKPVGISTPTAKAKAKAGAAKGYEENPEFSCYYYNEDDPRICVCGRNTWKRGMLQAVPNVATPAGMVICGCCGVGPTALSIGVFVVLIPMMGNRNPDESKEQGGRYQDLIEKNCFRTKVQGDCVNEYKCVWCKEPGYYPYCVFETKCPGRLLSQESLVSNLTLPSAASVAVYD